MHRNIMSVIFVTAMASVLSGCAGYEINTGRGNIPGHWIRSEMQESDRAVESARQAGKDKICPVEFKEAEAAKDAAYDVFRACRTEEGAAMARQATAKAQALCPPVKTPEVKAPPTPPVTPPAPVAPPKPAAPTAKLSVVPASVTKGQTATLTWSSTNAASCDIQPGIGGVAPQGSMKITPVEAADYTIICKGEGGKADSAASVAVVIPPPPVPPKPAAKLCSPAVINVQFDTNKSAIKPQYRDELKKLADFLKEFPKATGTIEGHTDSDGGLAFNMKLSQSRAESVRNYLIKEFGISPDRLVAKGYGPKKPVADNATAAGKQKNRRIESNFTCNAQ